MSMSKVIITSELFKHLKCHEINGRGKFDAHVS